MHSHCTHNVFTSGRRDRDWCEQMAATPLFNFRLDEERKAEWEAYIEEHDQYETVAELIRGAVAAERKRSDDNNGPESPALSQDVQQLREDVDRIKKDVRWLRTHREDAANISDLANDVRDDLIELPEISMEVPKDVDDESTYRHQARAAAALTPSGPDEPSPSYTVEAIAERIDTDSMLVREAINHLKDQFIPVTEVEVDGETHYFLEGQ